MSINRIPFNALADDDGTGTTGTPWNKQAIKDVLLDPIDAAIVAVPAPTVALYSGSGSSTAAGVDTLVNLNVPALGLLDTLEIYWDLWVSGPAATTIQADIFVSGSTAGQLLTITGADAGPDLTGYAMGRYVITIRCAPGSPLTLVATAYGMVNIGAPQTLGRVWGRNVAMTSWAAPWTLLMRQISGVPAGTPLAWSAAVYLRKG